MAAIAIESSLSVIRVPESASNNPRKKGSLSRPMDASGFGNRGGIEPSHAFARLQSMATPSLPNDRYSTLHGNFDRRGSLCRGRSLYGDDFRLNAKVLMGKADKLRLVTITEDGREHVIPMLPQKSGLWLAHLQRVRQPMQFYVRSEDTSRKRGRFRFAWYRELKRRSSGSLLLLTRNDNPIRALSLKKESMGSRGL